MFTLHTQSCHALRICLLSRRLPSNRWRTFISRVISRLARASAAAVEFSTQRCANAAARLVGKALRAQLGDRVRATLAAVQQPALNHNAPEIATKIEVTATALGWKLLCNVRFPVAAVQQSIGRASCRMAAQPSQPAALAAVAATPPPRIARTKLGKWPH